MVIILDEAVVALHVNRVKVPANAVIYSDTSAESSVAGGGTGAIAGAIDAGLAGAMVGAILGAGAAIDPGLTVTT